MKQNKHIHKTHPNGLRLKYSTKWILEFDTDNAFDSESYVNRKITANALFQWFLFHFDRFRFGDGRLFAPIAMSAQCSCVEHSIANPMATCRNGDGLSSNIDLIYSMSEPRLGLNDNFIRIARKCAWLNCVELSDNDWVDIGIHLKLKWIQQIFDYFSVKMLNVYVYMHTHKQIHFCSFCFCQNAEVCIFRLLFLLTARVSPGNPTAINLNYASHLHMVYIDFFSVVRHAQIWCVFFCVWPFAVFGCICHSALSKTESNLVPDRMHAIFFPRTVSRSVNCPGVRNKCLCRLDIDQPSSSSWLFYTEIDYDNKWSSYGLMNAIASH